MSDLHFRMKFVNNEGKQVECFKSFANVESMKDRVSMVLESLRQPVTEVIAMGMKGLSEESTNG